MFMWSEGWDKYGATADLAIRYYQRDPGPSSSFLPTGGRSGAGGLQLNNYGGYFSCLMPSTSAAGAPIHAAFWVYSTNFAGAGSLLTFKNSVSGKMGGLYMETTASGKLVARPWDVPSDTNVESSVTLADSVWHHVEIAASYKTSGGWVKVWVDEVLVLNLTGNLGAGEVIDSFELGTAKWPIATIYDDIVVWDETVPAEAPVDGLSVAQLKKHKIETYTPVADGASVEMTPNTGANYAAVDDDPFHDGTATYVDGVAAGKRDYYTFAPMATEPAMFWGVVLHARAKYAVASNIRMTEYDNIRGNPADRQDGPSQALPAAFGDLFTFFPVVATYIPLLNPVVWTKAWFNRAQFGVKQDT